VTDPRPGARTSRDGGVRECRPDFRVSEEEFAYIKELAREHGLSLSALIRSCLLVDMPKTKDEDHE
jgi:PP-loop superfamily ATP-utilizing enzyme